MKIKSYKELDVWKKGIEIADGVYKMTGKFPKEERYGLATFRLRLIVRRGLYDNIQRNISSFVA